MSLSSLSKILLVLSLTIFSFAGFTACSYKSEVKNDGEAPGNTVVAREAKVGSRPPEFELSKLDGKKISFDDLDGNPAVIVFWTAWCPSCKEEAPLINKLVDDYDGKGVRVLGINIGEGEARVREGVKDFGIKYDIVRDADTKVAKSYNVVGTPTIVFLDKNGITRYVGNELPKDYSARLDALISEN